MRIRRIKKPMKKLLLTPLFIVSLLVAAQEPAPLSVYADQVGSTWVIDAQWGNGSPFKQEITLSYGLNNAVVIAKTRGFIDQEQTTLGDRNHGIRKFNSETNQIEFWEFDAFGGLTQGTVTVKGKDLYYVYEYQGTWLADIWEYKDEDTYVYKVAQYVDGTVGDVYLTGEYKRKK